MCVRGRETITWYLISLSVQCVSLTEIINVLYFLHDAHHIFPLRLYLQAYDSKPPGLFTAKPSSFLYLAILKVDIKLTPYTSTINIFTVTYL